MTDQERHATVMWMAETGLDKVKGELLENIVASYRQVFNAASGKVLELVLGTIMNASVLETMNYFRKNEIKEKL